MVKVDKSNINDTYSKGKAKEVITIEDCKTVCNVDKWCKAFEFDANNGCVHFNTIELVDDDERACNIKEVVKVVKEAKPVTDIEEGMACQHSDKVRRRMTDKYVWNSEEGRLLLYECKETVYRAAGFVDQYYSMDKDENKQCSPDYIGLAGF